MKKAMILLFAALCACSPFSVELSQTVGSGLREMTFTAYQEDLTKTSLGADYTVRWSNSDEVTLFAATGSAGETFSVSSASGDGLTATFTGLTHETSNGYY